MLTGTSLYTTSAWNRNPRALWNHYGMYQGGGDSLLPPPLQLSTTRTENDEGRPIPTNQKPSFSLV